MIKIWLFSYFSYSFCYFFAMLFTSEIKKDVRSMKKKIITFMAAGAMTMLFSGCAEDNYNSYNTQSSYDRKMEYEVHKDAAEASKMLSAQDIKNIENMK